MTREVVIVAAGRSATSRSNKGALAHKRSDDLLADALRELFARLPKFDKQAIDDFILGCAAPEGECGLNVARQAALVAGLPPFVPAITVSRFELSALSALVLGYSTISGGNADLMLVGGLESASRIPSGGYNPSPNPTLLESQPDSLLPMILAADFLAPKLGFTRSELDDYVLASVARARMALEKGRFTNELLPQTVLSHQGGEHLHQQDDLPPLTSSEELAALPPHFLRNGVLTLGNTAHAADGAALVLLASAERARNLGLTPLAILRGSALCSLAPEQAGLAASKAAQTVLSKARLAAAKLGQVEVEEFNALEALALARELALPDTSIVNPNGGALALGHWGGAAGTRLVVSLVHSLRVRGLRFGLAAQNSLGGTGGALLLENAEISA